MKLIEWSKAFALNLDGIDAQHQSLFCIINRLWQAIVNRAGNDEVRRCLDELDHYAAAHFAAEEAFMQAIRYPALMAHQREHQDFVKRIGDARKDVLDGAGLGLELLNFLQLWLINHIKTADREYADFALGQPAAKREASFLGRIFSRWGLPSGG